MIEQYPHYLFLSIAEPSTQDDEGNWLKQEGTTIFYGMCREETNGKGMQIRSADGTYHTFSSVIQLPKDSATLEVGTTVYISNNSDGSDLRIQGSVFKFDKGQLHNRLWL